LRPRYQDEVGQRAGRLEDHLVALGRWEHPVPRFVPLHARVLHGRVSHQCPASILEPMSDAVSDDGFIHVASRVKPDEIAIQA
jgi:hypothetical protein